MADATEDVDEDLLTITDIKHAIQKVFGISPCHFQIDLCLAQLQANRNEQDIISTAATGSRTTLCFLMPLLFNGGKLIIIVTALNLLGEQFVSIVKAAGFKAIAVTKDNNKKAVFEVRLGQLSSFDEVNPGIRKSETDFLSRFFRQ